MVASIIRTPYISSEDQISDILTKGLSRALQQAGNDKSPFAWGSGSVCVSLMSHVLVLIVLELYSLICSLVTSSRIGKAGVRMLYITAAILYQY